ncbi:hypothetical protein, partial [Escherichia coli]|uniref:hypothetical protein n=1 Tax=Escherichia coli TaxID=562 RepID=UPI0010CC2A37
DWADRPGEANKVEAITIRATRAFSQIKDAMVFAFNLPPIVELGTATGFYFYLLHPAGLCPAILPQRRTPFLVVSPHPPYILTPSLSLLLLSHPSVFFFF